MLSSRWHTLKVYRCWRALLGVYHYIAASDKKNAEDAYFSVTGLVPDYVELCREYTNFIVTEEAQAQSELFPNQVRK